MLSDAEIKIAKSKVKYSLPGGGQHDHNDCIRMAYEWLDAQKKIKKSNIKIISNKAHYRKMGRSIYFNLGC